MYISLNWIKEYVDLSNIEVDELIKRFGLSTAEIEGVEHKGADIQNIVFGKILKIEKHPEADRLVVCQVDIGSEITQLITAATNVFEGAVVPVSLEGADLVNGIKISKTKMRGVESCGMFCSGEELGIDENYIEGAGVNGILILPNDPQKVLHISG